MRLALLLSVLAAANPWPAQRVMNIAHQAGEDEAPSNTMYAYDRALALGADMLEVDVHSTATGIWPCSTTGAWTAPPRAATPSTT